MKEFEKNEKQARDKEDAEWRAAGDGKKTAVQQKREAAAAAAEAAAARRREAREQAAAEHAELGKKPGPDPLRPKLGQMTPSLGPVGAAAAGLRPSVGNAKVTQAQIRAHQEAEDEARKERERERDRAARREVTADDYARGIDAHTTAGPSTPHGARGDAALPASPHGRGAVGGRAGAGDAAGALAHLVDLGLGDAQLRAAAAEPLTFKKFFSRELPALREEKPGLREPQYRDIAYKAWTRSAENPLNQKG